MEPLGSERHRPQPTSVSFREKANQSKCASTNCPKSLSHTGYTIYPRRESNPHLRFRKPPFYPLNYGDISEIECQKAEIRYYVANTKKSRGRDRTRPRKFGTRRSVSLQLERFHPGSSLALGLDCPPDN